MTYTCDVSGGTLFWATLNPLTLILTGGTYFWDCFDSEGNTIGTDRWLYILIQGQALSAYFLGF